MKLLVNELRIKSTASQLYSSKGSCLLPAGFINDISPDSLEAVMHRGNRVFIVMHNDRFYKMTKEQYEEYKGKGYIKNQAEFSESFSMFMYALDSAFSREGIKVYIDDKVKLCCGGCMVFEAVFMLDNRSVRVAMNSKRVFVAVFLDKADSIFSSPDAMETIKFLLDNAGTKETKHLELNFHSMEAKEQYKNVAISRSDVSTTVMTFVYKGTHFKVEFSAEDNLIMVKITYGSGDMDILCYACSEFDTDEFDRQLDNCISYKEDEARMLCGFLEY